MKSSRLSILQIINVRWFNASAEYAIAISRYLKEKGHNILIVCKEGIPAMKIAIDSGLEVNTELSFKPLKFFHDLRKLKDICNRIKPDIIHAHHAEGHVIAVILKKFLNGQKVIRTRVDIRDPKKNFFNRFIHENTDCVIVPGELLREKVTRSTGINSAKVRVVYGGVDLKRFSENSNGFEFRRSYRIPERATVIGLIARLDPVKGHLFFIKLAHELKSIFPEIKFVVVGREAEYRIEYLKRCAGQYGLDNEIIYTNFVKDVAPAIKSFDICILPSLGSEAHPRVLFEYMACGKPVVASRVGIVSEIIDDGVNGLIAEPADIQSFVDKIKILLFNPEKRSVLGSEARKKIERDFTIDKFVNDIEKLYFQIVDGL